MPLSLLSLSSSLVSPLRGAIRLTLASIETVEAVESSDTPGKGVRRKGADLPAEASQRLVTLSDRREGRTPL